MNKKIILFVIIGIIILCLCIMGIDSTSEQKQTNITPNQACNFLNEKGLSTSDWQNDGTNNYFCISNYKILDNGGKSNIAYSVEGEKDLVSKLTIEARVYKGSNPSIITNALIDTSKLLSQKVFNSYLSDSIADALINGTNITENLNGYTVEVYKDNFNSGYSIQFIIHVK